MVNRNSFYKPKMVFGTKNMVPVITAILFVNSWATEFAGGNGTKESPYRIATLEHLNNVRNYKHAHFILENDIDFTGSEFSRKKGWEPIGDEHKRFYGTFDGNNYSIKKLYIDDQSRDYAGLFGALQGAVISRLRLEDCFVSGNNKTGSIAGDNWFGSVIELCSATGSVYGTDDVGGLVGSSRYQNPAIKNCFTNVSVTGLVNVGGIAGFAQNTIISTCYALGLVKVQGRNGGGITGSINESTMESCFFNMETVHQSGADNGTPLTTREMKKMSTYTGWDFQKVWDIDRKTNNGYPFLRKAGRTYYANIEYRSAFSQERLLTKDDIQTITASSVCKGKYNYDPENISDSDSSTAWVEGVEGPGEGEWIEVTFRKKYNIDKIAFINGYSKSKELYFANNRIRDLTITTWSEAGEKGVSVVLDDDSYKGNEAIVPVIFEGFGNAVKIRFTIKSTYKGTKYDDTCISEIIFYGKDAE